MREVSRYVYGLFVFLAFLAFSNLHKPVQGQQHSREPVRVLVDASKDGGLWWYPQAHTFNPKEYHQGKGFADLIRGKGWQVTELPRGELITFDKLRKADVVIRPPAFFSYRAEEANAYQQSVIAGTRLILMGGGSTAFDAVPEAFGLRFESLNQLGPVTQWIPHPLTTYIECCDRPWTPLSDIPPAAVVLAWLNQLEPNKHPVLGYLPYGHGYVVFVGNALTNRLLLDNVVDVVGRHAAAEFQQLPVGQPISAAQSLELPPQLLEPAANAQLPQRYAAEWRFDWEDVAGAKAYELVVLGGSAAFPLVQTTTSKSEHTIPISQGYIAAHNLLGWSWRVRAQSANGTWGPWSDVRRFNVSPR